MRTCWYILWSSLRSLGRLFNDMSLRIKMLVGVWLYLVLLQVAVLLLFIATGKR